MRLHTYSYGFPATRHLSLGEVWFGSNNTESGVVIRDCRDTCAFGGHVHYVARPGGGPATVEGEAGGQRSLPDTVAAENVDIRLQVFPTRPLKTTTLHR